MSFDSLGALFDAEPATKGKSGFDTLGEALNAAPAPAKISTYQPYEFDRAGIPDAAGQALARQNLTPQSAGPEWTPGSAMHGAGEAMATMGAGAAANLMGGAREIYKRVTGAYDNIKAEGDKDGSSADTTAMRAAAARKDTSDYIDNHSYTPKTEEAKKILETIGLIAKPFEGLGPQSEMLALPHAPAGARAQLADIAATRGGAGAKAQALYQAIGDAGGEFAAKPMTIAAAKIERDRAEMNHPSVMNRVIDMVAQRQGIPASRVAPGDVRRPLPPAGVAAEDVPGALSAEAAAAMGAENGITPAMAKAEETTRRRSTLARVFGEGSKIRQSAVNGDFVEAKAILDASKATNAQGGALKTMLREEKNGLENHVSKIIEDTGGTIGSDQAAKEAAGNVGGEFFDKLREHKDAVRKTLYQDIEAENQKHGVTVDMAPVRNFLDDRGFVNDMATTDNNTRLLARVKDQLELLHDNNGGRFGVNEAEKFRKYLNSKWSPENAGALRQIKDKVDETVFNSAGADNFAPARKAHEDMKTVLAPFENYFDNKKGTTERRVSAEKVIDKINGGDTPLDRYATMLHTIREAPPELQPLAQQFESELMAGHANKLHAVGIQKTPESQWNAPQFQSYIMANNSKMAMAFERHPELLKRIQDAREAGNMIRIDPNYVGAGNSIENALLTGVAPYLDKALHSGGAVLGEGIGNSIGLPGVGSIVGSQLTKAAQSRVAAKMSARALRKSMVTLTDDERKR